MSGASARLPALLEPATTAVLTMEVQRGVCGDLASLAALAAEVQAGGVLPRIAGICAAARAAGARVVHCTAAFRPDGAGSLANARILASTRKLNEHRMDLGAEGTQLIPEIGPDPADIVVQRLHGLTPFTSTSLDQILRNLGITTIVATGVSLNVGVLGMVLTAVDLGYQVVLPRDAAAAVPAAYADAVIDGTLSMLATLCSAADVVAAWRPQDG